LLGHGAFEQAFAVGGEFAEGADVARGHLRIAVELLAGGSEAFELLLAVTRMTFRAPLALPFGDQRYPPAISCGYMFGSGLPARSAR
jgi:hypothetical protein